MWLRTGLWAKAHSQQVICKQVVAAETVEEIQLYMHAQGCHSLCSTHIHTQKHTPSNCGVFFQFPFQEGKKMLLRVPSCHLRASQNTHSRLTSDIFPPSPKQPLFPSLLPLLSSPVPVTVNSTPCTQTHTRKPQCDTNSTNTRKRQPTPAAVEENKRGVEKNGGRQQTHGKGGALISYFTLSNSWLSAKGNPWL